MDWQLPSPQGDRKWMPTADGNIKWMQDSFHIHDKDHDAILDHDRVESFYKDMSDQFTEMHSKLDYNMKVTLTTPIM